MPRGNAPFGDIFQVNSPYIDQVGKAIYQQEQQRKAYQQQQDKMLDDEFARNLTGIRDSDIPDLTKAYGDFKQARMQTLNKPNISPDQQMDVLRKKAGVYDIINQSKTQREWEQAQGKQIMQDKKGIYADDAHQQLIQRMKTPVGKIDPNNDSKLLYPYSMPDLSKELDHARGKGTEKDVTVTLGQNPNDKFKDDKEIYKVGNNPTQFFNGLSQGVTASNKARNFVGIVNQKYNDQELQDLENKYWAKVSDPKFIQVYGKPESFPEYANNTDLGRAAKIETMEEFVNKPFAPSRKVSEINQERKMADTHKFAIDQQARGDFYARRRQQIGQSLREATIDYKADKTAAENEGVLNKFIDASAEAGNKKLNGGNVEFVDIGGDRYKGKFIEVPKPIKDEYAKYGGKDKAGNDIWTYPDRFYLTDDKKSVIPLFFGDKTKTGGNYIKSDSKPIPIQLYKASLAKILLTKKDTGSEVTDDDLTEDEGNIPAAKTSHVEMHKTTKTTHKKDPLGIF